MFFHHAFIFRLFSIGFFSSPLKCAEVSHWERSGKRGDNRITTVRSSRTITFDSPLIETSRKTIYTCGLYFSLPTLSYGHCQVGSWAIIQMEQLVLRSFLFPCLPNSHLSCSPSLLGPLSFLGFIDTRIFWSPLSSLTAPLLSFFVALPILLKWINIKIPKVQS